MGRTRSQINKPHKTRFTSKSARNLHRTSAQDSVRIGKPKSKTLQGAKDARNQREKMLREQKRAAVLKEKRESGGSTRAPRVIVLFPLSASVELNSLGEDIINVLSTDGSGMASSTVASSEFKLRAKVLKAPHGDLLTCMEMAKVADLMAFVASASSPWEENISNYIDSFGSQCLSVFKSIGLPSTAVFIRGLPIESKKKNESKMLCISQLSPKFPEECKFYPADTTDELRKFMRLFKAQRLTVPEWRRQRSYVVADKAGMLVDDESLGKCTLLLSGYLRARKLSINQLVHVSGVGDFQLSKIDVLNDPFPLNERKKRNTMELDDSHDEEVLRTLLPDPLKQEQLVVENTPDPLAGEQTWPTEEEMAEADRNQKQGKLKKRTLPRGTSDYQAAWIVDETDGEGSDSGDSDDNNAMELDRGEDRFDQEFEDELESLNLEDIDNETQNDSEMIEGENLTREQIEDEIKKIKEAHAEDQEFPDEVETPIDVPARKRFAKYRGVKSFRTSSWDANESLPQDYARIFAFDNVARTQKLVLKEALKMEEEIRDDCVSSGSYVRLHIKEVPLGAATKLSSLVNTKPVIAFGLLQHESKISVLNFSLRKYNGYEAPIKTKEELMFHVGFRQFIARPVFASDNFRSDKHKMERFLHPGGFALASVYGPISFPPLPLVVVKMSEGLDSGAPAVAALGSLKSIDPNKMILKKIVLTGYPQRVSKMKASVRYMFHNPEDVRWFKPVEVHTKLGKRGRVKEPLGTHGAMKCVFNGVVQQHDVVCMDLWKRAYPKWPEHMNPNLL